MAGGEAARTMLSPARATDVDPAKQDQVDARMRGHTYSVVIPVYNSEAIVATTVTRVTSFFEAHGLAYEVILVNDGSRDGSWGVIAALAREHPHVTAINLLRNYGQHSANLCGLRATTGDYVVTLDDDLQNPPEEMLHLINTAADGYDAVYGKFDRKQASRGRSIGSRVIGLINRRIFRQPSDLTVTNYRLLRRDVVDRICADRSAYPYITGLSLLYSTQRANVLVRHEPRPVGRSNYNVLALTRLVLTILFSYSAFPLHLAAVVGVITSLASFVIGVVFFVRALLFGSRVEGWPSLVVLLAFFNGVMIAMLSMIGEYLVRTLNQVSAREPYHVADTVGAH